jgi:hypothetical protein
MKAALFPLALLVLVSFAWLLDAAKAASQAVAASPFAGGRWIDLTHAFSSDSLYWPTAQRFQLDVEMKAFTEKG